VFETRADIRYCLSRVVRAHRLGLIEVIAFVFLLTHFHFMFRSVTGELPRAMQYIMSPLVRWFNRRRDRDGPLFRGRYGSSRVLSEAYCYSLIRYIDHNPVKAGIVTDPSSYPFGSAYLYTRTDGPLWLARKDMEIATRLSTGAEGLSPDAYRATFGIEPTDAERTIIERRMVGVYPDEDPLDDLLGAAPPAIQDWLRRRAAMADGTKPGVPVISPATLREVIAVNRTRDPGWSVRPGRRQLDAWDLVLGGLSRVLCGMSFRELAQSLGESESSVLRRFRDHLALLADAEEYAIRVAEVAAACLERDHPTKRTLGILDRASGRDR
jgi:hypothetical protein